MKNLLIAVAVLLIINLLFLVVLADASEGKTVIQLHVASYHINRLPDYNEKNLGVGFRKYYDKESITYYSAGFYDNSEYSRSEYIGYGWEKSYRDFSLGIQAGLLTGYNIAEVVPYVVPVIRYKSLALVFAPYPEAVVHLTIDMIEF